MTEREKIVEVMARELRAFKEPGYGSTLLTVLAAWVEEEFPSPREAAMAENSAWDTITAIASAALTALEASGMAVVPVSECVELLPPELSEARIRELCDEMAMDTGKQPSAGKMRNAVRKQHADLNGKRIDQAFASSDRVFLFPVGKAPAPEGSAEAQSAVAHSPTPSMTENADE